ncbi:MAG: fumarylacetoacetate hydrolase family protein [Gammaproteobacteria bacterium]|jgi:2-keto-4-pentenoate hydratase/2-oxohepta-3-ene-1,7-dioic acid hydratase in catechol pathway|nr:fumarylacetoacetate hydrolase family protein [Gammaproteobacteria bacterium]
MNSNNSMARVFCIGQNYVAHIRELGNPMPTSPVIFMRPLACLVAPGEKIQFPRHGKLLHYEVEVVVRIGKPGRDIDETQALSHIDAVTLGVDLTLRDLQKKAREKGLPWDAAKAFEQSAPLGEFLPYDPVTMDLKHLAFRCRVNGQLRQDGNTDDMLFSFERLIAELSKIWILRPGDMIFTGTPSGVGALGSGDVIAVDNDQIGSFSWTLVD